MKKIIAICLLLTLVVGPNLALAGSVSTGLSRGTGGGSSPIIKAKWEMKGPCLDANETDYLACPSIGEGKDDSTAPGAQFNAPGVWDAKMEYTVCAIATDPNGVSDIDGVYADIFYPIGIAMHDKNPSTDTHPDNAGGNADEGVGACEAFIEENTLVQLTKSEGYNLFCQQIRGNNTNLPVFAPGYDYNEICAQDGELMKEEAYVYCSDKELIWEDPAGFYKVDAFAQDNSGNNSAILTNNFEYLPFTGFEKDFTGVAYGQVLLNTHKIISGNLVFGDNATSPTIRNTGNTRLWMWAAQDDMGLGKSSGLWNVEYDARVGNNEADWTIYSPFDYQGTGAPTWPGEYTRLEDILDLSETEEMDFSILVKKWPNTNTTYNGTLWLGATMAPFRDCD